MKLIALSSVITIFTLSGCNSSSGSSDEDVSDLIGAGDTLRLISEQRTSSSGDIVTTNYQFDDSGNLVGEVTGNASLTYNIDTNGRIIDSVFSDDGITFRDSQIFHYDAIGGLRRVDNLGFIQGMGVLGVSAFTLYQFDGDVVTSSEGRSIPFDDIIIDAEIDDSAGFITFTTEYRYDDERLVQELVDLDVDGVVDWQRDYTYNADGMLASTLQTGTSSNSTVFVYEQGACNLNWGNSTNRYFCVSNNGL